MLWEISSGQPPFYNESRDFLITEILQNRRETPVSNSSKEYVKIYTGKYDLNLIIILYFWPTRGAILGKIPLREVLKFLFISFLDCWNGVPDNRPTIQEVFNRLNASSKQIINEAVLPLPNFNIIVEEIIDLLNKLEERNDRLFSIISSIIIM